MTFGKKILDIREKESDYVRKDRTAGMLMHFSWTLAPFAVCVKYSCIERTTKQYTLILTGCRNDAVNKENKKYLLKDNHRSLNGNLFSKK